MKNLLLLIIGVFILVALFADGGLELSPNLSPEMRAQLDFSPSVSYAPSTTNIASNIESQVIYEAPPTPLPTATPVACTPLADESILAYNADGSCVLLNTQTGQQWHFNTQGVRLPLGQPTAPPNGEPVGLYTLKTHEALPLDELEAVFLRNGGQLPWLWDLRNDRSKLEWLKAQATQ